MACAMYVGRVREGRKTEGKEEGERGREGGREQEGERERERTSRSLL